jgi:hypothetical protein
MKETQQKYVTDFLKKEGYISRNQCLQQRITRLGAIIFTLKEMGYQFEPKWVKENGGRNFYYYLISAPKIRRSEIINGVAVEVFS